MSEQAPEPAGGGGGGGGGGLFKRKIGPLPMWAWLAIGATIILAYVIIKRQSSSSAASTTTADTSTPASDVPQFINQTYTTVTPPAASGTGTTTTTPPVGTTLPVVKTPPPAARPSQITASGKDTGDINQIAKLYGLTEQQLIAANPGLRKIKVKSPNGKTIPLIGSGAPVPKGTVVKIPSAPK
jgi:hypothetical protein